MSTVVVVVVGIQDAGDVCMRAGEEPTVVDSSYTTLEGQRLPAAANIMVRRQDWPRREALLPCAQVASKSSSAMRPG